MAEPVGSATLSKSELGLNDSPNNTKLWGAGISALGDLSQGFNALSTAKFNARLTEKYGMEKFQSIMDEMKQAVGSYKAAQGASGVRGGSATDRLQQARSLGVRDASRAKYAYDIEAANMRYEGKMAQAKAIQGAGQSLLGGMGA